MNAVDGGGRVSPTLVAMLLADARLPTAGHTQSGGLEPALAHGLAPDAVPDYCRTRLATVTRTEAATAVVARHVVLDRADLARVDQAWAARTPSDAMRHSSRHLARGLLRLARTLLPGSDAMASLGSPAAGSERPGRAVVLGALAAEVGLPAEDLARVVAYDDVQTVAAAALKLTPLDPAVAATWVWRLLPEVDTLAAEVGGLTRPEEIPAHGAPQIEAWAQAHARTTRRLFSA